MKFDDLVQDEWQYDEATQSVITHAGTVAQLPEIDIVEALGPEDSARLGHLLASANNLLEVCEEVYDALGGSKYKKHFKGELSLLHDVLEQSQNF